MGKFSNTKSGFTLVEVLVSVGIILLFLPFAANLLINSQILASYSKHKIQAAYAAQQIIETQRQEPISYFAPKLATQNPVNTTITGAVVLDTKGNYSNTICNSNVNIFCGTATITVTPETYTNNAGQITTSPTAIFTPSIGAPYSYYTMAHLAIKISWIEHKIPMNEYYAEDIIVNDPMLN